jgi:hypothetical protein
VLIAWLQKGGTTFEVDATQQLPRIRLVATSVQSCSTTAAPEPARGAAQAPPRVTNARVDLVRQMGGGRRLFAVRSADRRGVARDHVRVETNGRTTFDGRVELATRSDDDSASDLILADWEFEPEEVADVTGLVCLLSNPDAPVTKFLTRFARARQLERRAAGLRLPMVLTNLGNGLLQEIHSEGPPLAERFRRFALRPDTWTAIREIDRVRQQAALKPGRRGLRQATSSDVQPLATRRLAMLLVADLLSPHILLSREKRDGGWAAIFRALAAPPTAAQSWSVYRTDVEKDEVKSRELRIELANPAGNVNPGNRLVVGKYVGTAFSSCLKVETTGAVTLSGDLEIEGRWIVAPVPPDPTDPRFASDVIGAWLGGTVQGVAAVSTLDLRFVDLVSAKTGTPWPYKVTVKNTDGTNAVTNVKVFESLGINTTIIPPRPIGTFASIAAGASETINVTHDPLTAPTGNISVAVSAIGVGSTLGIMAAVKVQTVNIVS